MLRSSLGKSNTRTPLRPMQNTTNALRSPQLGTSKTPKPSTSILKPSTTATNAKDSRAPSNANLNVTTATQSNWHTPSTNSLVRAPSQTLGGAPQAPQLQDQLPTLPQGQQIGQGGQVGEVGPSQTARAGHQRALDFRGVEELKEDLARLESRCREAEREKEEVQKDHEKCFERQKDLVVQFRTEQELQQEEAARLRAEVTRLKLELAKGDSEAGEWRERLLGRKTELEGSEAQQQQLRKELMLLAKKLEAGHAEVTKAQLELVKAGREKEALRGELAEVEGGLARERADKERYWAQLQEERVRRAELGENNGKLKDEGRGLYELVERLREEMRQLRASNEAALKLIAKE